MKKDQRSAVSKVAREGQLEFLHQLYENGVPLDQEEIDLLIRHHYIKPKKAKKPKSEDGIDRKPEALDHKSVTQSRADKYIDIIEGDNELIPDDAKSIILDEDTYDKIAQTSLFKYQGGREIHKSDWMPADLIYHTTEFVNFINSINSGFQNMTRYVPFAMYCQQAEDWLNDNITEDSFDNPDDLREYRFNEIERCRDNTLYFMDKYLFYKEAKARSGMKRYVSAPVHKVLCYLIDCGYSLMAGKPRQIAATTTIGGIATAKLIFNKNFFIKMIAQDKEKVIEIYDDKIMFPFGELPEWMKPSVSNFRDSFLRLSRKTSKGTRGGANSKLQVVAPSVSAINGGAPPMVLIDEAGYIGILGKMIKEARPTMFAMNEETGKLEITRQIVIWGTGGEVDKGGKAYEIEFMDALAKWNAGNFENGIIPIFFDWTTRPGITKRHYDSEKKVYTVEGPDKENKMVQFRQTYPSILEDMFLTSHKLLVGIDWINQNLERIKNKDHSFRPTKGYFEPIYDTSSPADENSDVPFKIIGATFVPLDDLVDDMSRATVEILQSPQAGWRDRYVQGTDPIMMDNGLSNMASVVFDKRFNTPVAIMDYRDPNHHNTFLQCLLLGIYYDVERRGGIPELVESNIGQAYIDYKQLKGYGRNLVQRLELPDHMQGGGHLHGIDNRGQRNKFIINKLYEVLAAYGEKIWFDKPFRQLRTFVCTITEKGNETWGVTDPRSYHDDVLFALVFSYICALTYSHREAKNMAAEGNKHKVEYKLVRGRDGMLTRVPTIVRA